MSSDKASKSGESGPDGTKPGVTRKRGTTLDQIMTVYLLVVVMISCSWVLGSMGYSFMWVFLLTSALFVVWKTKLANIVRRHLEFEEERIHRKRALKQGETAEWLNFVINRWWVFNSETIEDLVKKRIDERLTIVKTPVVDNIELVTFTFGDYTPTIKHINAFEYADGIPGGRKQISWTNINKPPVGLDKLTSYQIVIEMDVASVCEDFKMIFRSTIGSGKASLSFDAAVEDLSISGTLQVVLHMSMDTPFPHISKASISFTQLPNVWFNVRILKSLHLMEVPIVKSWIHTHVMEGITKALVDPGKIDIPLSLAGAVQMRQPGKPKPKQLAQGVLTIHIRGSPVTNKTDADDVRYTMLRISDKKRQTPDVLAIEQWEDVCSFIIYNLAKEKLIIKSKCRRLLTNVTLEYHCLELASFPLAVEKNVTTVVKMKDGSELELKFQYTPLPVIDLEYNFVTKAQDVTDVSGVMYVCLHGARNVIASDRGGTSDPYCVLFCDRRRVMTTPFVPRTLNPTWNSVAEFFIGDFTKCNLSFYVYDWDGTNIIDDDFLGAAHLSLKEEEPSVVKKCLTLGCIKSGEGYVEDIAYGQIIVSVVFRPVSSVFKSERFRHASVANSNRDYLYTEDLVSPSSKPPHKTRFSSSISADHQGGGPHSPVVKKTSLAGEILEDKIFVDFTILQAKDLVGMDRNGLSDPFCEVLMENGKLFKTSVKKNTLFPKWNESFSYEVIDDTKLIEINVYDKDIISKDFLGKVVLSMDKLKEISHKGKPEWLSLQRTKSGKLQIKCTVMSKDTIEKDNLNKTNKEREYPAMRNSTKLDDNVFFPNDSIIKEEKAEKQKSAPPPPSQSTQNVLIPPASHTSSVSMPFFEETSKQPPINGTPKSSLTHEVQSNSQKPKPGDSSLKRSASDVNVNKRNGDDMEGYSTLPRSSRNLRHADSSNSFAARTGPDNISIVPNDQSHPLDESVTPDVTPDSSVSGDKFYSVSGKVAKIRGLRTPDTKFYCKVRLEEPSHGHRLRLFSSHHSRVIAKSSLQEAVDPIVNLAFEVDRGAGVNTGASLIFDIKQDSKEHLAENSFCLKDLLDEHSEEPVQRWIKLSNGVDIEIVLRRGSPNLRLANKKSPGRFIKSWSFRKEKIH